MNKQVKKNLLQMKKIYKTLAKSALRQKAVNVVMSDIKSHFKKGDHWPLRYESYYEMSKVSMMEVFNTLLESQGYDVHYDEAHVGFMIKLNKKMLKKYKVIGIS